MSEKTATAKKVAQLWKARVYFLLGKTVKEASRISGASYGSINGIVTKGNLNTARGREDLRVTHLIILHRSAPHGLESFVEVEMSKMPQTWQHSTALMQFRKEKDLGPTASDSERVVVLRKGRGVGKNELQFNDATDGMSALLSKAKITQWQYDAAMSYRRDTEIMESFRGQDPSKDNVGGGGVSGSITDTQAQSLDRLMQVRQAIVLVVKGGALGDRYAVTRWACLKMTYKDSMGLVQKQLQYIAETLEPIAWVYNMAPAGDIADRLSRIAVDGRLPKPRIEE